MKPGATVHHPVQRMCCRGAPPCEAPRVAACTTPCSGRAPPPPHPLCAAPPLKGRARTCKKKTGASAAPAKLRRRPPARLHRPAPVRTRVGTTALETHAAGTSAPRHARRRRVSRCQPFASAARPSPIPTRMEAAGLIPAPARALCRQAGRPEALPAPRRYRPTRDLSAAVLTNPGGADDRGHGTDRPPKAPRVLGTDAGHPHATGRARVQLSVG